MSKNIGVCAPYFWWTLMTLLCLTCIALEVASLSTPRWFEQGSSTGHWEGGLLKSYPSETYYKDKDCDRDYHRDGYCDMFKHLWVGGVVYVVCEAVSLALFASCVVIYLVYLNKKSTKCVLVTFFIWAAAVFHIVGFITWAVLAKMTYKGKCKSLYSNHGTDPARICRKEGATLALLTILYVPLVAMLQSLLWYYSRKEVEENPKMKEYKNPVENPEMSSREESSREFYSSQEYNSESVDASK